MPDFSTLLKRGCVWLLALAAAAIALPALAQSDPPGRIGRIAWISGDVSLIRPDSGERGEHESVLLNQPLTGGDIVATGPGARAEIQVGAMTLRLDSRTRIEFERLDDDNVRIRLDEGRVIAKLPSEDIRRDFTLETPHGRFVPRDTGIYRFEHDGGYTAATAYFGTVRFDSADIALDVNAGEGTRLWQERDGRLAYQMVPGIRDEFTQWSAARDQRQQASIASRYVSPEMTGTQDLDAYGDWSEMPEYGAVWFPRAVGADWAPYRTGHWAWVAPWGWTWVGHEPWGFAPFHYGRWERIHGVWAWVPGTRVTRPVYAPALVAWGGTPGFGFSISVGSPPPARWAPLAPREVYVPFYRSSHAHVRHVNAPHGARIHDIDAIVSRPHEVVRQTRYVHRDDPRVVHIAPSTMRHTSRPESGMRDNPQDDRRPRQTEHRQAAPAVVVRVPRVEAQEPPRPRAEERHTFREPRREVSSAVRAESRATIEARMTAPRVERSSQRYEQRERREQRDDRHERRQRPEDERRR